jgi:Uma2 family endonuclease
VSDMASNTTEMARSRPITADEYHRMGEIGILGPDERVELLNGRIIEMPPIGPRHSYVVISLDALMQRTLGDRAVVVAQGPIRLDRFSEPQPDVLIVRGPREQYASHHARPEDTLLVIEVAESTLRYDRGEKLRAYARMGIAEYWIVDIAHERLHAFTEPDGERYRTEVVVERGGQIAPRALPDDLVALDDILVPRG